MKNAKDLIAKAKTNLILTQPFFASLLLPMPITEDTSIATMATDGESIKINPKWTESLTLSEVTFVLAHEVMHCAFQHMCRRGARNHNKWNVATDYVINEALTQERIGVMPKGGLQDTKIFNQGSGTAEGIYAILPKETESKKPGQKGGALDDLHDAGSEQGQKAVDAATLAQKESEMRVKITQARNAAKMQGKLSAGLERLVSELVRTRTDWREILRKFITERQKIDFTFAKPKRRFLADDLLLPSLTGEKIGTIAVAVDCSGSVNDAQLAVFEAEIRAIFQDLSPSEIKIIYFDSKILRVQSVEADSFKLEAIGGGGTAFTPIFTELNASDELPVACVVLTDLESDAFGSAPDYPVLWANYGAVDNTAPFGEVINIKEGR